ncbi:heterokaryon incompatibility protein-domain-containing protein [Trametes meyenii]|nr:heterokaryon incompatibility protein-domain-containing protein [Trametes meyenii]
MARSLLCEDCWSGPFAPDTFRQLVGNQREVNYATTQNRIQQAANGGCGLCGFLLASWDIPIAPDSTDEEVTISLRMGIHIGADDTTASIYRTANPTTPPGVMSLTCEVTGISDSRSVGYSQVYLRTSSDDPAAAEVVARDPILEVRSSQCFSLALESIDKCTNAHKYCPKPTSALPLPTRVIDCLDPSHPRLFITEDIPGNYAALSYVWGGEQPHRTVQSNILAYINHIDVALVPQTIRDAITVVSHIGLRYLWVDSFCIIQDSREDKIRELVKLRHIFRNAYVTIVAACAPCASSGFLHDRAAPTVSASTPRLPYWCEDGQLGTVNTEPVNVTSTDPIVVHEPVDQRAWCLEERLLSPRKLVYANNTLQYHCQSSITCVGNTISRPQFSAMRLQDVMFLSDEAIEGHLSSESRRFNVWRFLRWSWSDILTNYTRRIVTKPRDKLTALSGVAEQFHRVLRYAEGVEPRKTNRYLAGLWEHTFLHDLLWWRWDEASPTKHRDSQLYLAPSWSWASLDEPVTLNPSLNDPLRMERYASFIRASRVVSCEVTLVDFRLPHGRIHDARLQLQAQLIPVGCRWQADRLLEPGLYLKHSGADISCGLWVMGVQDPRTAGPFTRVGDVRMDSTDEVEGQVWAVPILWHPGWHAAGLLLAKAEGQNTFIRIGCWVTLEECVDEDEGTTGPRGKEVVAWIETFQPADDSVAGSTLPILELV